MSNVFEKDGKWFFWDEAAMISNPFDTALQALKAYGDYCLEILNSLVEESELNVCGLEYVQAGNACNRPVVYCVRKPGHDFACSDDKVKQGV